MTDIKTEQEYQNIIKENYLIIVFEDYCELSKVFIDNLKNINFEKIFLVDRKKNNILFNKLFFLSTPTIIFNKKIIIPGDINSLNHIIEHTP